MPLIALVAAIAGVVLGRALDVLGARLMAGDPETDVVTLRVAAAPLWPPDLCSLRPGRLLKRDSTAVSEVAAALAAVGLVLIVDGGRLVHAAAFTVIFLFLGFVDLRERIVPNVVVLPAGLLAVAFAAAGLGPSWRAAIVGSAAGLLFFGLIYGGGVLVARRMGLEEDAIGLGDVKLAALLGLVLGWPTVFPALLGGILIGGFVSALLVLSRRTGLRSYIPYAPFLLLAAYLSLVLRSG